MIKPYFETELGKLYYGDCLEIMKEMEDESVDLVLTDPPYVGLQGGDQHWGYGGVGPNYRKYTRVGDPWEANFNWLLVAWRVTKLGMITFCTYHNAPEIVKILSMGKRIALACWYKRNAPPPIRNVPRHTIEFMWYLYKNRGLLWGKLKTHYDIPNLSAGCVASKERLLDDKKCAVHPTQKPLALIVQLAEATDIYHMVLDPFIGIGTTAIACERLNRRWIGIEISKEYCDIAVDRIKKETAQYKLDMV